MLNYFFKLNQFVLKIFQCDHLRCKKWSITYASKLVNEYYFAFYLDQSESKNRYHDQQIDKELDK